MTLSGNKGSNFDMGANGGGVSLEIKTVVRTSKWLTAFRALILLALGALMIVRPVQSIGVLTIVLGFIVLIDGVATLISSIAAKEMPRRGAMIALSILMILAAAMMIVHPLFMDGFLIVFIGVWEILCGIEGLTELKILGRPKTTVLSSCLAILAGIVLVLLPLLGLTAMTMVAGFILAATAFVFLFSLVQGSLLFRAAIFLVLGVLMLVSPLRSMETITRILGAFAMADGILMAAGALRLRSMPGRWFAFLLGLLVVLLGAIALILPFQMDYAFLVFLGVWQFVSGVEDLFQIRFAKNKPLAALSAVLTIAVGLFFVVAPFVGALAIDLLFGVMLIVVACLTFLASLRAPERQ